MKRIFFLTLICLIAIAATSCKKSGSPDPDPTDTGTDPVATYYITFKADGVAVSETEVTASRGTATDPRTLTIIGTAKDGAAPQFTFYMEETFIGFTKGLNVGNKTSTYPSDYIEYTNSSNVLYSTKNDASGISLFVSDISYTNGGVVTGTFSGSIKTAGGVAVQITDGKFNVKCGN
ncbi:MAG TPA: hypothetical protein VK668_11180 [Mucilaginibacter sp.]|nr:hypothetical protein [Mucilaginibacter sp.]